MLPWEPHTAFSVDFCQFSNIHHYGWTALSFKDLSAVWCRREWVTGVGYRGGLQEWATDTRVIKTVWKDSDGILHVLVFLTAVMDQTKFTATPLGTAVEGFVWWTESYSSDKDTLTFAF